MGAEEEVRDDSIFGRSGLTMRMMRMKCAVAPPADGLSERMHC